MPADIPGGDFSGCVEHFMEQGHDEASAEAICGALEEEAKSDLGDPGELLDALENATGMIVDGALDLVSGVDVPAIDSKWVMMKSDADGHDWQTVAPILLSKQEGEEKRISYAPAMIPRQPDKEGEVVPTPTVEKMAHGFLANEESGIDTDHSLIDGEGTVVESWILKEDRSFDLPDGGEETYPAGTWMLGIKWEAEPWERIKSGELTGLSIYGMAEHVQLSATAKSLCAECEARIGRETADGERTKASAGQDGEREPHMADPDNDNTDDADGGGDGGEGPEIEALEEQISDLEDQVSNLTDTVEASEGTDDGETETEQEEKADESVSDVIDEFVDRLADMEEVEASASSLREVIQDALSRADDDDEDGEEEESSKDSEEQTAKHKGGMGEGTRTAALTDKREGSGKGLTSYRELAEEATE